MDKRDEKTLKVIKHATLELFKNKNIDQITICAICKEANISRSTFYLHYENIGDLINQIEDELIDPIFAISLKFTKSNIQDKFIEIAKYIKLNHKKYQTIIKRDADHFESRAKRRTDELMNLYLNYKSNDIFAKYYYCFVINGAVGVFKAWILDNCKYDEKEIINNFINNIKISLNDLTYTDFIKKK